MLPKDKDLNMSKHDAMQVNKPVYNYGTSQTQHLLAEYIESINQLHPKPDAIEKQINISDYEAKAKKNIIDQLKQGVSLGQEHIEIDLMPNLFDDQRSNEREVRLEKSLENFDAESFGGEFPPIKSFSHTDFNDIVNRTWFAIKNLTELKGGEYAGDVDRLANFRLISEQLGVPMETVWSVYASKHWAAVMQYAKDLKENKVRDRMEPIEGRCDDLIVYLMLFKAMIKERNSK